MNGYTLCVTLAVEGLCWLLLRQRARRRKALLRRRRAREREQQARLLRAFNRGTLGALWKGGWL